jgi:hypothetical protein
MEDATMIGARRWIGGVLVGTLILTLAVGSALLRSAWRGDPGPDRAPTFPEVEELRVAVAQCTSELAAEQERFDAHHRTVDSLRAAVLAYESTDRTVPAEVFDEYLDTFTAYNQSVHDWHGRAAALEAHWEECHDLAERHNTLVDSLSIRPPAEPTTGAG